MRSIGRFLRTALLVALFLILGGTSLVSTLLHIQELQAAYAYQFGADDYERATLEITNARANRPPSRRSSGSRSVSFIIEGRLARSPAPEWTFAPHDFVRAVGTDRLHRDELDDLTLEVLLSPTTRTPRQAFPKLRGFGLGVNPRVIPTSLVMVDRPGLGLAFTIGKIVVPWCLFIGYFVILTRLGLAAEKAKYARGGDEAHDAEDDPRY